MLRSIAGTAGTLSLALLLVGGCSKDDVKPAAGAPAPVSTDASAPAPDASAPTAGATGAPAETTTPPQPGTAEGTGRPPSRPGAPALPDVGAQRVGWVTATVTSAGGSCYELKAADGATWAAYSKKDVPVSRGDKVRVRLTPGKTPVDCGPGKPATLVRVLINPK
ncbi:hypothetical protein M1L60_43200 [Actinoplanes sp. TRM 88003]|uniref:Lipoprotein n=1 Tax=Paractinoplanes aksuensis TaxID=2939490 RepID=A0ABT1E2Q2_9ACTN|nr:hypothetical protein [Actinoplanes aksuensis]MCO8277407.1 hypothetical protein [Actinoplanes aksuensis]